MIVSDVIAIKDTRVCPSCTTVILDTADVENTTRAYIVHKSYQVIMIKSICRKRRWNFHFVYHLHFRYCNLENLISDSKIFTLYTSFYTACILLQLSVQWNKFIGMNANIMTILTINVCGTVKYTQWPTTTTAAARATISTKQHNMVYYIHFRSLQIMAKGICIRHRCSEKAVSSNVVYTSDRMNLPGSDKVCETERWSDRWMDHVILVSTRPGAVTDG